MISVKNYAVGLVFAFSFLVVTNARADIVVDTLPVGAKEIFSFSLTKILEGDTFANTISVAVNGESYTAEYGGSKSVGSKPYAYHNISLDLSALGGTNPLGFTVTWNDNAFKNVTQGSAVSPYAFLSNLMIGEQQEYLPGGGWGVNNVEDMKSYFTQSGTYYSFGSEANSWNWDDDDLLTFAFFEQNFKNTNGMYVGQTITFTFYGDPLAASEPTNTPEPATLAVVGLGLAGLGLARRRMMK